MADIAGPIRNYVEQNRDRFLEELFELLRIPSVSAQSELDKDTAACADLLASRFKELGFPITIHQTTGHPILTGQRMDAPGAPTVLIYGHYDVQPVDPIDLWETPPFEPTVKNGNIYCRGATDDKGQMYTHVKALETVLNTAGKLPINVKLIIEGEEEVGSPNLENFIAANTDALACDYVIISDCSQFDYDVPAITYGLKGLAYMEINMTGPGQDLHSGSFGGTVANPCNMLMDLVSGMMDDKGQVTIPGFYDDVLPLEDWERKEFARLPFDEEDYRKMTGSPKLTGEAGYTTLERRWARPTLDVNGIWGGYQEEGAKTIIPAKSGAKVSMRLVPNQTPDKIEKLFTDYVKAHAPDTVEVEVKALHGGHPVLVNTDSPGMTAAKKAVEQGFGTAPVLMREGGSIPIVSVFKEVLGADSLLLGWGLPDDNTHSPNEKFNLEDYYRGITSSAILMHELAG